MSDHLPECTEIVGEVGVSNLCICHRLRECESRVRHEGLGVCIEHYDMGYAQALTAAHDVLADLRDESCGCLGGHTIDVVATEAIDALRGASA